MNVTFYGESCFAAEIAGKSLFFDPFVRPDELARDVDVPAVRAEDRPVKRRRFDPVADAVECAGRTGALVTVRVRSGDF